MARAPAPTGRCRTASTSRTAKGRRTSTCAIAVSINMSYDLPFHGNRLTDGWQVVVVEQAQTGNPLNIITNISTITGVNSLRPDLIGALPAITRMRTTTRTASRSVISGSTVHRLRSADRRVVHVARRSSRSPTTPLVSRTSGISARNAIYGPGFGNTDFSVIKNVRLQGSARVQLRVEVFNLFNQANFGQPGRTATVGSTSFGVISNTRFPTGDSGSARQVQFAAKFLF